jgi:aspartate/methionine/tyrosine aminotransferase
MEVLRATRVMLVQGTGFNWGPPEHFRIVFLPHEDDLREAIGPRGQASWRSTASATPKARLILFF